MEPRPVGALLVIRRWLPPRRAFMKMLNSARSGLDSKAIHFQFSYQPSSAIPTRIDLILREVVAVATPRAPPRPAVPHHQTLFILWPPGPLARPVGAPPPSLSDLHTTGRVLS